VRILIAEDDLTSRTVLRVALTKHGHEVIEAVDGADALKALQRPDAPRVAILDWMMPALDGLQVCRLIRALAATNPPYLIILTVRGETADIIAGLEAGADDYLSKPFDVNELRARVDVGCRMIDAQSALAHTITELREALEHVKTLRGFLPMCPFCKNIRDVQGYWSQVEAYVSAHTEVQFSHGICTACMKQHYPEFADQENTGRDE
jgi:DNA-binding response OmpR family regulator